MRILGLIPARGGSKGVHRKNIRPLNGVPLIGYSIIAGLASSVLDRVMVSTEDEEIAGIARELGAQVPFLRPEALATDAAPTLKVVQHALETLQAQGEDFDAVCLLQPTVPFRTATHIQEAVAAFEEANSDSLVSVAAIPHQYNPHWAFLPSDDGQHLHIATGDAELISRRQELPTAYHRDGSIYLTKTSVLLNQDSLYGNSIAWYEPQGSPNINIDTEADWQKAEAYLAAHER